MLLHGVRFAHPPKDFRPQRPGTLALEDMHFGAEGCAAYARLFEDAKEESAKVRQGQQFAQVFALRFRGLSDHQAAPLPASWAKSDVPPPVSVSDRSRAPCAACCIGWASAAALAVAAS